MDLLVSFSTDSSFEVGGGGWAGLQLAFSLERLQDKLTAEWWWWGVVLVRALRAGAGVQQRDLGTKVVGDTWLPRQDQCPAVVWEGCPCLSVAGV